jgi:hypothetical protein
VFRSHALQVEVHVPLLCRSVTMDAWTDDQLKKMQLGGNARVNEFLGKHGVDKETPILEKYNSKAAAVRLPVPCTWSLLAIQTCSFE